MSLIFLTFAKNIKIFYLKIDTVILLIFLNNFSD